MGNYSLLALLINSFDTDLPPDRTGALPRVQTDWRKLLYVLPARVTRGIEETKPKAQ